jgi:hypothetical protein
MLQVFDLVLVGVVGGLLDEGDDRIEGLGLEVGGAHFKFHDLCHKAPFG